MTHSDIAAALFAAFEVGDADAVRGLCTEDFQARQNNGLAMDLESVLAFSAAVLSVVDDFRYEEVVRSATESGFVEEHSVRGTLPDGTPLDIRACVVADLRDGKVGNLREYLDGLTATGLMAALQAR